MSVRTVDGVSWCDIPYGPNHSGLKSATNPLFTNQQGAFSILVESAALYSCVLHLSFPCFYVEPDINT